ncbi:hypothetical protein [Burkholderia ubonensis]|uniref:hypothetical protein n=1 Tax=Burkholderia ubonensis TaxID=101571 RepID=UPI0012F8E096|nr:hypothetical protein [Burkholderia ubonensis]
MSNLELLPDSSWCGSLPRAQARVNRRRNAAGGMRDVASFKPAAPHPAAASCGVFGRRTGMTERCTRDTTRGARRAGAMRQSARVR